MSNIEKKKFYRENWFIWIMLILFAPIGIVLLWINKESKYDNKRKVIITTIWPLVFVIITVLIAIGQPTGTIDEEPTMAQHEQSKEEIEKDEEIAKLKETLDADKDNKEEIEAELNIILASYDVLSLDVLTLSAGGNSAMISIISDTSKPEELAEEVANKINGIIDVYDINIVNKKSKITARINN